MKIIRHVYFSGNCPIHFPTHRAIFLIVSQMRKAQRYNHLRIQVWWHLPKYLFLQYQQHTIE